MFTVGKSDTVKERVRCIWEEPWVGLVHGAPPCSLPYVKALLFHPSRSRPIPKIPTFVTEQFCVQGSQLLHNTIHYFFVVVQYICILLSKPKTILTHDLLHWLDIKLSVYPYF